jgi:hypothetical protein
MNAQTIGILRRRYLFFKLPMQYLGSLKKPISFLAYLAYLAVQAFSFPALNALNVPNVPNALNVLDFLPFPLLMAGCL